jgi:hypothetical protein
VQTAGGEETIDRRGEERRGEELDCGEVEFLAAATVLSCRL